MRMMKATRRRSNGNNSVLSLPDIVWKGEAHAMPAVVDCHAEWGFLVVCPTSGHHLHRLNGPLGGHNA
mgnify:CR=1 FL=1